MCILARTEFTLKLAIFIFPADIVVSVVAEEFSEQFRSVACTGQHENYARMYAISGVNSMQFATAG
jgi:hypothetical protein